MLGFNFFDENQENKSTSPNYFYQLELKLK